MKVGILALQGDVREHAAALAEVGAEPVEVRRPEHLAGVGGLVLPGGESTTLSMLLDSSGLRPAVAERLSDGMPALGTCAGLILLARRVEDGRADQRGFGVVDVAVRRNGFGRQLQSFECELEAPALGGLPLPAVFIRAPLVEEVGEGVEVLATLDVPGGSSPVLLRQGPYVIASFHPELSGDRRVHELFVQRVD